MNKFGERIESLRHECKLTLKQAAEALSIPQSRLSEIEKGVRIPTPGQVERMAGFYDVPADELAALTN